MSWSGTARTEGLATSRGANDDKRLAFRGWHASRARSEPPSNPDDRRVRMIRVRHQCLPVAVDQQISGFQRRLADQHLVAEHQKSLGHQAGPSSEHPACLNPQPDRSLASRLRRSCPWHLLNSHSREWCWDKIYVSNAEPVTCVVVSMGSHSAGRLSRGGAGAPISTYSFHAQLFSSHPARIFLRLRQRCHITQLARLLFEACWKC